ncbi:PF11689 family protein [Leptospira interrogans serovar Pyrogenes str. 2006006960]|nr:PF11689 family protein [Leptospira interrogans serovar Pyrogenes str. 2006006960]
MNSTERTFYGSPFWVPKGTFFKCSDKNESFYLQKVCFSDREKFSEPYRPHPKIGKTQHNAFLWVALENSAQRFPMGRVGKLSTTLSYGSRWKTQHNAFLWVALENSAQRFPMGRVVGWELSFTEDFVVIPTIDLEIQLFVGLVMGRSAWWELSFTEDLL